MAEVLSPDEQRRALEAGAAWYRVTLLGLRYEALIIGTGKARRLLDYRGPLPEPARTREA
jgi:hypothetical protein